MRAATVLSVLFCAYKLQMLTALQICYRSFSGHPFSTYAPTRLAVKSALIACHVHLHPEPYINYIGALPPGWHPSTALLLHIAVDILSKLSQQSRYSRLDISRCYPVPYCSLECVHRIYKKKNHLTCAIT